MCLETGKGDYGVVLTSHDVAKQESAVGALTKAFKFDAKVAATILKNAPMVVFEGLTGALGKRVLEKMKGLSDAGCELKLVQAPFETKKKLTWPKPHAFVRQALEEAVQAPAEEAVVAEAVPDDTIEITCPKCEKNFAFDPAPTEEAAPAPAKAAPAPAKAAPAPPTAAPAPPKAAPAPPKAAPPAAGPVEEIEGLERAIQAEPVELPASELPASEVPVSEVLPDAGEISDDIMDLDEFEASLGEMDLEGPSAGVGDAEELDQFAGAHAVESDTVDEEKSVPEKPKKVPPKLQKTVRYTKPKPKSAAPAASDGGPGPYRVILSKMRSDKMRNDAAEIIAQIQGISQEEALKVAGKLIVTAAKDVTESKANEIKNTFTEKGIKAMVSKRK